MKKILALLLFSVLLASSFVSAGLKIDENKSQKLSIKESDDYYFIQITDTHILHEKFDDNKTNINILKLVLKKINQLKEKPKFVVMTGDLVEWGGEGDTGKLNYQAFKDCIHENNGEFYIDPEHIIPIYCIPGNNDYLWESSLENYHECISDQDKYVITYRDATLIFMDSGYNYKKNPVDWFRVKGSGLSDEDIEWLENQLEKCTTKHKIVLMHHPAVNGRDALGEMSSVIAKNRGNFVNLCEEYNVEVVLSGHTHTSRTYDKEENRYQDYPLNCSKYSTLYVQSEDCTEDAYYRNISFVNGNVYIGRNVKIEFDKKDSRDLPICNFLKSKLNLFTVFYNIRQLLMKVQKDLFINPNMARVN